MPEWLTSTPLDLAIVAAKAVLMYATALLGLRFAERRTLAQWRTIDFVAAVAIGAIVGRTALADTQTYMTGAVALVSIIAVHRCAAFGRFNPMFRRLVDHRVRLLVIDGRIRRRELRRCGLTEEDLASELRQLGCRTLTDLRCVFFEPAGGFTIVPEHAPEPAELINDAYQRLPDRDEYRL